jgi:hypothetical protein
MYSYLIGDVGKEIALPGEPRVGWNNYSRPFCINIIFWALYDTENDVDKQRKTAIAKTLSAFEGLEVNCSMLKVLRQGLISQRSFIDDDILGKYKQERGIVFARSIGYFCIKVTLHDHWLVLLLAKLKNIIHDLADDFIIMHDIDIGTDCHYITSRPILQAFLMENYRDIVDIVDDIAKVGNHCISWISATDHGQKV